MPTHASFWRFWGFGPINGEQNISAIHKRTSARKHVIWHTNVRTDRQNLSTDAVSQRSKNKVKENGMSYTLSGTCDKSRVRLNHPRRRSAAWIYMCAHTRDVVIESRSRGGRNLATPVT